MEVVMNAANIIEGGVNAAVVAEGKKGCVGNRPVLTRVQAELISDIFSTIFPDGFGETIQELKEISNTFAVASEMCRRAAEIHEGLQVPWARMCWGACLPADAKNMVSSQDMIELMLGPLHVDLKRQYNPKRGCALPNFAPVAKFFDEEELEFAPPNVGP
jgi:hypothetical protein